MPTLRNIDLLVNGERAEQANLNRPLIQLRDNQIAQYNSLASIGNGNVLGLTSDFGGSVHITENLTVDGEFRTLAVQAEFGGNVHIVGDLILDGVFRATDGSIRIDSDVEIYDDLYVNGALSIGGEAVATENFVLLNGGGASGGGVEITKTFEYLGDGTTTTFLANFISSSISVFVEGIRYTDLDYTLNYDLVDPLIGVSVTFNNAPVDGDKIVIVAYGGADLYTKTQTDILISQVVADSNDNFAMNALESKNLIINGNMIHNQTNFDGVTFIDREFVWDMWEATATGITQTIEDGRYIPNTTYTLSGINVVTQQLTSPASGHWTLPEIPTTSRKVVLILGDTEKVYVESEDTLHYRYYYTQSGISWNGYFNEAIGITGKAFQFHFPQETAQLPVINVNNLLIEATSANTSGPTNILVDQVTSKSVNYSYTYTGLSSSAGALTYDIIVDSRIYRA